MAGQSTVKVDVKILDALVANIANRDWQAVEAVGNQVREILEDEGFIKTHRKIKK